MSFESVSEFIQMGRHGPYVWSSYGIFLLVLLLNVFIPLRAQKRVMAAQARQIRREDSLRQRSDAEKGGADASDS